jgi:uncharacterized spore protein YtfJ
MKLNELVAAAQDGLTAKRVYGEPYTEGGITIIPAAKVMGGGGGGGGHDSAGQEGEGGGLGMIARPVGAFVIKNGEVRWVAAFDLNRAVLLAGAIAYATIRLRRRRLS